MLKLAATKNIVSAIFPLGFLSALVKPPARDDSILTNVAGITKTGSAEQQERARAGSHHSGESSESEKDDEEEDEEEEENQNPNEKRFDFRFGALPDGVTYIGTAPELKLQTNGSTVLEVPKGTILKIPIGFQGNCGDEKINSYTIQMDVCVDLTSLTRQCDGIGLLQAAFPSPHMSDECMLLKSGVVGPPSCSSQEVGKNVFPSNDEKWHRISITGEAASNRVNTYVDGIICRSATVTGGMDGPFALPRDGFLLFASYKPQCIPGIKIRHLSFEPIVLNASQISNRKKDHWYYNPFLRKNERTLKKMMDNMSLRPLFRKPHPIWADRAFFTMFGDAYIEGSGLAGGSMFEGLRVFTLVLKKLTLENVPSHVQQAVLVAQKAFEDAIPLFRKYNKTSDCSFIKSYLRILASYREKLAVGEYLVLPGGYTHPEHTSNMVMILERPTEKQYRLVLNNTGKGSEYHPVNAAIGYPKIKYKTSVSIDVPPEKIHDDSWWLFFITLTKSGNHKNDASMIYELLLPHVAGEPFESAICRNVDDLDWRTPQYTDGSDFFKSILASWHYLLRRQGLSTYETKNVHFLTRVAWTEMMQNDMQQVLSLRDSDCRLIRLGVKQLAFSSVKLSQKGTVDLGEVQKTCDNIEKRIQALPCEDENSIKPPPLLDLVSAPVECDWDIFPFFDRFRRDDIGGLEGSVKTAPMQLPIDLTSFPQVSDFRAALALLRRTSALCEQLSHLSGTRVKFAHHLTVSLIAHVFTHSLAPPLSEDAKRRSCASCMWECPNMHFGDVLSLLLVLQRLMEHFAAAALSLRNSRSFDATKIVVSACMAAIADNALRQDIPDKSLFMEQLQGKPVGKSGNRLACDLFVVQCETLEMTTQEVSLCRAGCVEYFSSFATNNARMSTIFDWENEKWMMYPETSTDELCNQTAEKLYGSADNSALSGEDGFFTHVFPELPPYRDICFYWKYFMCTDENAFPDVKHGHGPFLPQHAQLRWELSSRRGERRKTFYQISAFHQSDLFGNIRLKNMSATGHKYPSETIASRHTHTPVFTEDDVLHLRTLPTFDGALGQQDSEVVLSFLTVPLLRLPLMCAFFASEDRLHALQNATLRNLLHAVLFEPGLYLPCHLDDTCPIEVPCGSSRPELLGTCNGYLLTELCRSPRTLLGPVAKLLDMALSLDTGNPRSGSAEVILFLVRTGARVDNAIAFLQDFLQGKESSMHGRDVRDLSIPNSMRGVLDSGITNVRTLLRGKVVRMLTRWIERLEQEAEMEAKNLDKVTNLLCKLHTHRLLVWRNLHVEDFSKEMVQTILCSFIFLSTRHTWNSSDEDILCIPETELFELMTKLRPRLTTWLENAEVAAFHRIMESIHATATGAKPKDISLEGDDEDVEFFWCCVAGPENRGRFAGTYGPEAKVRYSEAKKENRVARMHVSTPYVEFNLQTCQFIVRGQRLNALDTDIAHNKDVIEVFGQNAHTMQCIVIESSEDRETRFLVSEGKKLEYWTQDPKRLPEPIHDRDYDPDELGPTEQWVGELFEPIRTSYFVRPSLDKDVAFFLPEDELLEDAYVCHLTAAHPKKSGTWFEVLCFKQHSCVLCYLIESVGRRFYRTLMYASNCKFSFRDLQPDTEDRSHPWPKWGRFEAQDECFMNMIMSSMPPAHPPSVVILRERPDYVIFPEDEELDAEEEPFESDEEDEEQEVLKGWERFIAARLLYGLLPHALLDANHFYQDEESPYHLRGYPKKEEDQGVYYLSVKLVYKTIPSLGDQGLCARCRQFFLLGPKAGQKRVLLNLLWAPQGTPLYSIAQLLSRVENLSHILAWTNLKDPDGRSCETPQEEPELNVDWVDLPRLGLSFFVGPGADGLLRLFSADHGHLSIPVVNPSNEVTALLRGVPHSLLLATMTNEFFILIPNICPIRPLIRSCPFSTELVLDRADSEWNDIISQKYYLCPIHVGGSFVMTPTLGSALYLLLLRFFYRDYVDVVNLVSAIGTDKKFTDEEKNAFGHLVQVRDAHPDAHACRAHISLATGDSPHVPPWDLPHEMGKYVQKLSHLDARCRLGKDEEIHLLEMTFALLKKRTLVSDATGSMASSFLHSAFRYMSGRSDALLSAKEKQKQQEYWLRFRQAIRGEGLATTDDEITMLVEKVIFSHPSIDDYLECLLKNRLAMLTLTEDDEKQEADLATPERASESKWILYVDKTSLSATADMWSKLSINFRSPKRIACLYACELVQEMWQDRENLMGDFREKGFLFIYQLFTGTIRYKALKQSPMERHSFAFLCLNLLFDDARNGSVLGSVLNLMAHGGVQHCEGAPRWKDTRKNKGSSYFKTWIDANEPNIPLADLLDNCTRWLADSHKSGYLKLPAEDAADNELLYPKLPTPQSTLRTVDIAHQVWLLATERATRVMGYGGVSNFACSQRTIEDLDDAAIPTSMSDLTMRVERMRRLTPSLLPSLMGTPLHSCTADFVATKKIAAVPNAGLPFHVPATSFVAKNTIARLKKDCALFAEQCRDVPQVTLRSLDLDELKRLEEMLLKIKEADATFIDLSIQLLLKEANQVTETGTDALQFLLLRTSAHESRLWLQFLFASVMSSHALVDWRRINPFLSEETVDQLLNIVCWTVLIANRVGQTNNALDTLVDLRKLIVKAERSSGQCTTAQTANIAQKADLLATILTKKRFYAQKTGHKCVVDPRFLIFEFTSNILLRERQVQLVNEFRTAVLGGTSLVKQMIMGGGKTTTVAPLLCLMLADGRTLVTSIVPPALLEFSRSVMRSTFSSIMHKKVYTFHCDRSTDIEPTVLKKLQNAVKTAALVVAVPSSMKSLLLKFVENMLILNDSAHKRAKDILLEAETQNVHKVLGLFNNAYCLVDEVDLVLHPLKSELNFPIGAKLSLDFSPLRWKLPLYLTEAFFIATKAQNVTLKSSSGVRRSIVAHLLPANMTENNTAHAVIAKLIAALHVGYTSKCLQRIPHIVLLNEDFYHAKLKPLLVEWLLIYLQQEHVADSVQYEDNLGLTAQEMTTYILERATPGSPLFAKVSMLTASDKKMLNLSYDWLFTYLPHCLSKVNRVTFGLLNKSDLERALEREPLMPLTRAKVCVPFIGKDVPSDASEFAHPDVVIGMTMLAYRYESLRYSDFTEMIDNLQISFASELGPVHERPSALRLKQWVEEMDAEVCGVTSLDDDDEDEENGTKKTISGGKKTDLVGKVRVMPLHLLQRSNSEQMDDLYNLLKQSPSAIQWYLLEFIFPTYMTFQEIKLSSSGQDIGGSMICKHRIGFSGTPSDLLPYELGSCAFEPGSEGLIMHTLTDPQVVLTHFVDSTTEWTVDGLLLRIAQQTEPRLNVLIDTGAMITGKSNKDVAIFLLEYGLAHCDAAVFLDEEDRKMVVTRMSRGKVVKLEECGIPKEKRFAYYDQIHCVGMDIRHTEDALAALTLGKDLTFRDYAQGAYRMRGIGIGQRIQLWVIPEVQLLISRELTKHNATALHTEKTEDGRQRKVLEEVAAWLVLNSMRSERLQWNNLQLQDLANAWRKGAFKELNENAVELRNTTVVDALQVFREPIEYAIESAVPQSYPFSHIIESKIAPNMRHVDAEHESILDAVREKVRGLEFSEGVGCLEQEKEQEQEQEKQREQEQEIEIEKFMDLAYSRDNEQPIPWRFAELANGDSIPSAFYQANTFALRKRKPINGFPSCVLMSTNYFNRSWSGARRLRNLIMSLEWIPDVSSTPLTKAVGQPCDALSPAVLKLMEQALHRIVALFDPDKRGGISVDDVHKVFATAFGPDLLDMQKVKADVAKLSSANAAGKLTIVSAQQLSALLLSSKYRPMEGGRFSVGVSLLEAETLRKIIHVRQTHDGLLDDVPELQIALRCVTVDKIFDESAKYRDGPSFQREAVRQTLRLIDCQTYFSDSEVLALLRCIQSVEPFARQVFFEQIVACRRRFAKNWRERPISVGLTTVSEHHLLLQTMLWVAVRKAIDGKDLALADAFHMFDADNDGLLAGEEVFGAVDYLGIPINALDVVELIDVADSTGDHFVTRKEFFDMVKHKVGYLFPDDAGFDSVSHRRPGLITTAHHFSPHLRFSPMTTVLEWDNPTTPPLTPGDLLELPSPTHIGSYRAQSDPPRSLLPYCLFPHKSPHWRSNRPIGVVPMRRSYPSDDGDLPSDLNLLSPLPPRALGRSLSEGASKHEIAVLHSFRSPGAMEKPEDAHKLQREVVRRLQQIKSTLPMHTLGAPVAKGRDELKAVRARLIEERKRIEEMQRASLRLEEDKILEELEIEEETKGEENPKYSPQRIEFDFTRGRLPKCVEAFGRIEYFPDKNDQFLQVDPKSFLLLGNLVLPADAIGGLVNQWSVTFVGRMNKLPDNAATLFHVRRFVEKKKDKKSAGAASAKKEENKEKDSSDGKKDDAKSKDAPVENVDEDHANNDVCNGDDGGKVKKSLSVEAVKKCSDTRANDGGEVFVLPKGTIALNQTKKENAASKSKLPRLKEREWTVMTIAVDCYKNTLTVFINGTLVVDVTDPILLRERGPYALDPVLGLAVFGSDTSRDKAKMVGGALRTVVVDGATLNADIVADSVISYGVWRCRSNAADCKKFNGPDSNNCYQCGAKRLKSARVPPNGRHPKHPELYVVTAETFEEVVMEGDVHVLLDVSADWCGPCRAFFPHLVKFAKLVANLEDLRVCYMDADENATDPTLLPEKFVPNIKLFVKGKQRSPVAMPRDIERNVEGIMQFVQMYISDLNFNRALNRAFPDYCEEKHVEYMLMVMFDRVLALRPSYPCRFMHALVQHRTGLKLDAEDKVEDIVEGESTGDSKKVKAEETKAAAKIRRKKSRGKTDAKKTVDDVESSDRIAAAHEKQMDEWMGEGDASGTTGHGATRNGIDSPMDERGAAGAYSGSLGEVGTKCVEDTYHRTRVEIAQSEEMVKAVLALGDGEGLSQVDDVVATFSDDLLRYWEKHQLGHLLLSIVQGLRKAQPVKVKPFLSAFLFRCAEPENRKGPYRYKDQFPQLSHGHADNLRESEILKVWPPLVRKVLDDPSLWREQHSTVLKNDIAPLLEHGLPIDSSPYGLYGQNFTMMALSAAINHIALAEFLFSLGAQVQRAMECRNTSISYTALELATANLSKDIAKFLLYQGVTLGNCFHIAALTGNVEIGRIVFERAKLDVNLRTSDGVRAIDAAVLAQKPAFVRFLVDARCDIGGEVCEVVRRAGMVEKKSSILHVAARRYQCLPLAEQVIHELMEHPDAVLGADDLGRSPVDIASGRLCPFFVPGTYWVCWESLDALPSQPEPWARTAEMHSWSIATWVALRRIPNSVLALASEDMSEEYMWVSWFHEQEGMRELKGILESKDAILHEVHVRGKKNMEDAKALVKDAKHPKDVTIIGERVKAQGPNGKTKEGVVTKIVKNDKVTIKWDDAKTSESDVPRAECCRLTSGTFLEGENNDVLFDCQWILNVPLDDIPPLPLDRGTGDLTRRVVDGVKEAPEDSPELALFFKGIKRQKPAKKVEKIIPYQNTRKEDDDDDDEMDYEEEQEEEDEMEVEEEEEEENEDDDPASAVVETSPSGNLVDDNDSTQDIEEESSGKAHRGDANESTQDENVTLRPDPLRIVEDEHHILVSCPKCRYEIHCTESGNLDGCQKVSPDIKRQCSSGRHTDVSWVSERDDSDYGTHDARAGHGSNREERGTNDASDQKATNAGGTTPPSVTSRVMKWNDYLVNTPRRHESRPSTSPEKPVRRLSLQGIGVTQGGVELIDQPGCPWTESQSLRTENKALSRRLAEDHARHQNEISYLRSERYRLTLALTQEQENVEEGTRQISRLENSLASLGAQRMRRHRREQQQADLESSQGWSFWSAFAGVTW
eukprot:GEMP01000007.1.p1 GENE.GEMP01000007.1~~GEMP01000007.1.p1  ORF type:complete len:5820 (+),score=1409.10 GEMP01000007.1:169-17628(+)